MKDEALKLALEAGAIHIHERPKEFAIVGNDSIKAFEALVRADEREACANAAEDFLTSGRSPLGRSVAAAIRARGNT